MPRRSATILVVDHESEPTRALLALLRKQGWSVVWVPDSEGAANALAHERIDALVCELRSARIDGLAVLELALQRGRGVVAVFVHEDPELPLAIEAMRRGAWDVLPKPASQEQLLASLIRGLEHQSLAQRVVAMESQLDRRFGLKTLTGRSRAIRRVSDQVRRVGPTRATVLIEGEDGTGKSVVARAIHRQSLRREEPFLWVPCGALDPAAVEAQLFGTESALADAQSGAYEKADGGTLFLDEVEHLSPSAQARLLRALQERAVERVGGREAIRADVRLVVATETDLGAQVTAGHFRDDLLYRIGMVRIIMPPLRERAEDLPLLVERFLRDLAREHHRRVRGVTPGVMERLRAHLWPGNVRELRDTLEAMLVVSPGGRLLEMAALPAGLRASEPPEGQLQVTVGMTVEQAERALIEATLRRVGGRKPEAAEMLGIGLRTLYRKLERYGLE